MNISAGYQWLNWIHQSSDQWSSGALFQSAYHRIYVVPILWPALCCELRLCMVHELQWSTNWKSMECFGNLAFRFVVLDPLPRFMSFLYLCLTSSYLLGTYYPNSDASQNIIFIAALFFWKLNINISKIHKSFSMQKCLRAKNIWVVFKIQTEGAV